MRHYISYTLTLLVLLVSVFYFNHSVRATSSDIHINEIGAFEPTGNEWLEIVNNGSDPIDLASWKFVEAAVNHGLTLAQGTDMILGPDEYAIIAQDAAAFIAAYPSVTARIFDSSWSTLNESGELVGLRDESETMVEEFTYYVSAPDFSLERKENIPDYTTANWIEHPNGHTAGTENYWTTNEPTEPIDSPPISIITAPNSGSVNTPISFDGSASTDDIGIVTYSWDFGDGTTESSATVQHTYTTASTYTVTLTVSDLALQTHTTSHTITITDTDTTTTTPPTGSTADIRINEIVSDPQTGTEWIELYNISASSISLDGCTLLDGVSTVATLAENISANGFVVYELSSAKLNNSGDIVQINCSSTVVDAVSYGNWNDGDTTNNAPTPAKGESIIRFPDGADTNTNSIDWTKTTTLTKQAANTQSSEPTTNTPSSQGGGGASTQTLTFSPSTIVINEFVSDPGDEGVEFIELYNRTASVIDLTRWYTEDGSEAKTALVGTINGFGYTVIESPKGQLNNAGDQITLYDPSDKEIDRVSYGTWDDGALSDNAPAPNDPYSLARKTNGQDADNDLYDFIKTDTITKGKPNIITNTNANPDELLQTITQAPANTKGIVINEIYPNPPGSDNDDEFVEIKNIGTETVSLTGWKLQDGSTGSGYTLPATTLPPNGLLTIKRTQSALALNNSGGEDVRLSLNNGTLVTKVSYTGSVADSMSYSRTTEGSYVWSTVATPNKENTIAAKNSAPKVLFDADTDVLVGETISFDASDTTDSDTDTLTFSWDFGDGESATGDAVEHVYMKRGIYTTKLQVIDSQKNTVEKRVVITVREDEGDTEILMSSELPPGLRINEIFPNPTGSDDGEFIELHNDSTETINISGLKLDDEDGGSRPFVFDDDTFIEAGEYRVFGKSETKLALNNTNDSVRLLDGSNSVLTSIDFDGVIEGTSYSLTTDDVWQWSSKPTPGEQNNDTLAKEKGVRKTKKAKTGGAVISTTLDKVREEDVGDRVQVTGVVAVLPDIFGTQYFYIVGEKTPPASGIQIYSYKKDFPNLSVGDVITVTGEISESSGETRIKTSEKSDMVQSGTTLDITAFPLETTEIGESVEGAFVRISGEVTEKKASYLYLDDGAGEIKVYFKKNTGLSGSEFQVGQKITVSGIVGETRSGYQLMPRDIADIAYEQTTEMLITKKEDTNSSSVAETYLTATAGGLTSILLGLLAKARGAVVLTFLKRVGKVALTVVKTKRG
jgi:PKD repeat protein